MKNTQGNWNVERVESKFFNGFKINAQLNGGTEIARINYAEEPEESDGALKELQANARLIAAAPELLEALQAYVGSRLGNQEEIKKWYDMYKNNELADKLLIKAIEAINKATKTNTL